MTPEARRVAAEELARKLCVAASTVSLFVPTTGYGDLYPSEQDAWCEVAMVALDALTRATQEAREEAKRDFEIMDARRGTLGNMLRYIAFVAAGDETADSQLAVDRLKERAERLQEIVASAHALACRCQPGAPDARCAALWAVAGERSADGQ